MGYLDLSGLTEKGSMPPDNNPASLNGTVQGFPATGGKGSGGARSGSETLKWNHSGALPVPNLGVAFGSFMYDKYFNAELTTS